MKSDLIENVIYRTFGYSLIGFISMIFLFTVNYLKTKEITSSIKTSVICFFINFMLTLMGSLLFFNH